MGYYLFYKYNRLRVLYLPSNNIILGTAFLLILLAGF